MIKLRSFLLPVAALLTALAAPGALAAPAHDQTHRVLIWSGQVDDTTVITVHQASVRADTVRGKAASDVNTWLSNPLPLRPTRVFLRHPQGRGDIYIIQQPTEGNGYTAKIRVHDPQPGRGYYAFTLGRGAAQPGGQAGRQFYQGRREAQFYRRSRVNRNRYYVSGGWPSEGDEFGWGFGDEGGFGDDDD